MQTADARARRAQCSAAAVLGPAQSPVFVRSVGDAARKSEALVNGTLQRAGNVGRLRWKEERLSLTERRKQRRETIERL